MTGVIEIYSNFITSLPFFGKNFINLFLIVILIFIYAVLIWKFYRFIAKKNLISLNLNQYNRSEHPLVNKAIKIIFYITEYIIILPALVFLWFAVFTIFLLFLTDKIEVHTLLIISATVVAAIRMAAYYKADLAKDLAKLLPFTLLGVSLTQSGLLNFNNILVKLIEIPLFLEEIIIYLLFIIVIEFILRLFEIFFITTGIHSEEEIQED
ncbi:MAG: hypothetical protein U9Q99_00725 [Nanoarchaeota archaeon]|nr:hypothetical protein [Nanoarchaeota archaeon]